MLRILTALGAIIILTTAAQAMDGIIVKNGALSVSDTVTKLEAIIEAAPPSLMAKIDHGANAKKAGMDIGESVLLVLGAPKIGTPMMQSNRLIGLDLPAKIRVYSENGQTKIAYTNPQILKDRHQISGADGQFEGMAKALDAFTMKASE
jgi:uncharacterized protein (DUF302 family)